MELLQERLERVATLKNARRWLDKDDQFVYCINLLDTYASWDGAFTWVDKLEERFETLLEEDEDLEQEGRS